MYVIMLAIFSTLTSLKINSGGGTLIKGDFDNIEIIVL